MALQFAIENCQVFIDPILTHFGLPQIVIDLPHAKVTHITIGRSSTATSEEFKEHIIAPNWSLWVSTQELANVPDLNISSTSSIHSLSPNQATNDNVARMKRPFDISEDRGDNKRCRQGTVSDPRNP